MNEILMVTNVQVKMIMPNIVVSALRVCWLHGLTVSVAFL